MAKDTFFSGTKSIRINGVVYNLDQPRIMGILNLSPDSFYDGGKYKNEDEILIRVQQMLDEGAWVIDIGGCSSRPGGELISEEKEIQRVIPIVKLLKEKYPTILFSIDTFRANVAEKCLQNGAEIINDISGGRWEPKIFEVIKKYDAAYILMHSRNEFTSMHDSTVYENIEIEVIHELNNQIQKLKEINYTNIIIDPGFGFSKNVEQNFDLLKTLKAFNSLNFPILVGISRKSFIWKTLGLDAKNALNGTSALHLHCLMNGANILRVHDVKEAKEVIDLFLKLK